ncbi:hypothetical protein, partial [Bergeriella denitrificans]|uniref:hypothetical protein n=1 Tax=Bergeriella denitrificans TaxID=494 RepID=UPI001C3FC78F
IPPEPAGFHPRFFPMRTNRPVCCIKNGSYTQAAGRLKIYPHLPTASASVYPSLKIRINPLKKLTN